MLAGWQPTVRMYDMTGSALSEPEALYMPFGLMVPMEIRTAGNSDGWARQPGNGFQASLASEQTYIQFWVELRSAADEQEYRAFIESYVTDQKKVGRFGRPMNYRVSSITALMNDFHVAPKETFALLMVGLLFLAVAARQPDRPAARQVPRARQRGRRAPGARRLAHATCSCSTSSSARWSRSSAGPSASAWRPSACARSTRSCST